MSCQGKPFDANDIILITFNVNGKVEQIIGFVEKVDPVDSKGNKLYFFFENGDVAHYFIDSFGDICINS